MFRDGAYVSVKDESSKGVEEAISSVVLQAAEEMPVHRRSERPRELASGSQVEQRGPRASLSRTRESQRRAGREKVGGRRTARVRLKQRKKRCRVE